MTDTFKSWFSEEKKVKEKNFLKSNEKKKNK